MSTFEERYNSTKASIEKAHLEMAAHHADFDVRYARQRAEIDAARNMFDSNFNSSFNTAGIKDVQGTDRTVREISEITYIK